MKIPPLILGLLLVVGAPLLGAPTQEVQISTPARKDSAAQADKGRSPTPEGPVIDSGRRGGLEDMVEIVGVSQQKPDASGRCKVTVRVRYALVHYPKGILSLGFNLKSATHFVQVSTQPVVAGSEEAELSATIVPVTWPKAQPFKLYVSLSAEPHPGQWSMLSATTEVMKPTAAAGPAH
jgi:hypothetical protein